jgi:hypothetical protein
MREGWLRRRYLWYLRRKEVMEARKKRDGQCVRCGSCCGHCIFHDPKNKRCRIYGLRPSICRMFPLNKQDVEDAKTCGFSFRD